MGRAHQEAGIAEGAGVPLARTVWVLWGEEVEGEHMGAAGYQAMERDKK